MIRVLIILSFIAGLSAADGLLIPIDPQQFKQLSETIMQAALSGDHSALLRNCRRALELAPNDPELQAPVYLLMSSASAALGEAERAADFKAIAWKLDPAIESRLNELGKTGTMRGDPTPTINNLVNVFGQVMGSIEQIRLMKICLDMVKHGMTPLPACGQVQGQQTMMQPGPGGPVPINGGPVQISGGPVQMTGGPVQISGGPNQISGGPVQMTGGPVQMTGAPAPIAPQAGGQSPVMIQSGANVVYLSAPVGSPTYQQPTAPPVPMVGWPGQSSPPVMVQQTPPQPQIDTTVASTRPRAGAPIQPQQLQPQLAQPDIGSQPNTNDQFVARPRQVSPQGSTNRPAAYSFAVPATRAPYANPQYRPRAGRVRGGDEPIYKVIHDHSDVGSATYFQTSCGGLLTVSGANLTFTGSGGEEPIVIPAGDIIDIRMNSLIGAEAGFLHIATRQGLYLSLAAESQDRQKARSMIEAINASLNLNK